MNVDIIWNNIVKCQGEKFHTTGREKIEFVYSFLDANTIMPKNVRGSKLYPIKKDTIEEVIAKYWPDSWPLTVSQLTDKYFAPSYIVAILTDSRIV